MSDDLPDVHFGSAEAPLSADWKDASDPEIDDELLSETPPDVVALLGFDPLEYRSDEMSRHDADDAPGNGKEPYGEASEADYADPGYQPDKQKRYPLKKDGEWDAERIRAAWDYIHHKKDGDKYTPEQRKEIEGRIVRAWKAGIDKDGPPEADNRKDSTMADKSEAEDRRDAGDDLEKVTKERDDLKRRLDALEKKMRADESEKERAENTREEDEERHDETDEEKRALKAANEARERERKDETEKAADARDEAAGKKEAREDGRSDARLGDGRSRADDRGAPDCPVEPDAPAMTAKPVHDAARVRELEQQVRTLRDQMAGLHYQPSIEDRNRIAELHHRADSLYQMLGDQAPRPLPGEGPAPYARRLASGLRKFTKSFKSYAIKDSLDEQAFGLVEAEIYREAEHTARNPVEPPPGGLREVRTMENGKQVSRFYGDARATWAPFMPPTITRMTFNHDRVRQAQQRA